MGSQARRVAAIVIGCGILLHLYTGLFKSSDGPGFFVLGLILWSCLPYLSAAALVYLFDRAPAALGAAMFALAADAWMHYTVFVKPQGSTAALGLLFMPLWNLLLLVPAGAALGWAVSKRLRSQ